MASVAIGGSPGEPGGGQEGQMPTLTDSDSDGMSDDAEAIAGTDPNDATSLLRITSLTRDANGLTFTWTSVVGKRYCLEHTASLSIPTWECVAEPEATSESTTARDDNTQRTTAKTGGYYRVSVSQ